ncbi:radical SAM domain-containing protein [Hyphomicrobium denitrificans 1NES1]|uniref:Radical SAM domain-containing protein n=1 Tax=Hyphomicrobium denitrificans 1NES1 TaxID=670307 RepID=N0B9C9_9HYPH|nr:radical SAM domain-containing protein [Hyphomicrobium denitrificans 1NES1]
MSGRIVASVARTALDQARQKMIETGQWDAAQSMGRRWPIGCVALEITQRCNLDCGACYLSEHSEAVRDLPLDEVYRRIDMIRDTYGSDVDVQVTGGDPTLRKQDELVAIVRRLREVGMRPALFTNGIRATRDLLVSLVEAGLVDVAFHVDLTQGRRGYQTEHDLNELRRTYIERARGLPLSVFFNTTVFDGNFDQVPHVVAFFVQYSDVVRLASFQPLAQTGRGTLRPRSPAINTASVTRQIEKGAGTTLSFDTAHAGHAQCNRYAMSLIVNGHAYDVLDNKGFYNLLVARTAGYRFDRQSRKRAVATFLRCLAANPEVIAKGAGWFASKLWRMKGDLVASRGRISKLSFFVHNFMDACNLDPERIKACTFMAATQDGPVSMCLHNAQRDRYILRPLKQIGSDGEEWWDPVTGRSARNVEDFSSHGSLSPAGLRRKKKALEVDNTAD